MSSILLSHLASDSCFSAKFYLLFLNIAHFKINVVKYIQGISVKCFRTPKRGKMHPDDSKSYRNVGLEMLF